MQQMSRKVTAPMCEEEKIFAGKLFAPGDEVLRSIKLKAHKLSADYSRLYEDEEEAREAILRELVGSMGEDVFIQGPVFFHYGSHTSIGSHVFINYNFTVQDDAKVTIGDHVSFGPNVTIVTPMHPKLPQERRSMICSDGVSRHLCYALPVSIGNDCWLGANVVICPGVTVGDNCIIGAGSVVTKDIPAGSIAAGNPARVLREINEADSLLKREDLFG